MHDDQKSPQNQDPMADPDKQPQDNFLVVGIGASAGGIKALKTFFSNVDPKSGSAYVVILHISPEHESHLAEVVQQDSAIPVIRVEDKLVQVRPDHVYVIPPDRSLIIENGHLATSEVKTHEERRAPVDIFFRTLAQTKGPRAVSVILSGTGPDGSMGIKRVKEMGGIVIVQEPSEAEYSDMPANTIATGLADYVLPVHSIPSHINEYRARLLKTDIVLSLNEEPEQKEERALLQVFTLIRSRTGHDFANYKRATVLRRIERRMNITGSSNLTSYAELLRNDRREADALLKDLLISVTNFFREREAFEFLESEVIPKILDGKSVKDRVRVWVAGCATGEEAYSIAMLLAEQTADNPDSPALQVFATDIDENAITSGRAALYSSSDVADVSPERLQRFFSQEGQNFRVTRQLREMVLFASHNVTSDPPFSKLDLITCRNLLIYLNRPAQNRVMETAHFALKPGGYLFVGASESADEQEELFTPVSKELRIYKSRAITSRISIPIPAAPRIPLIALRQYSENTTEEVRALERLSYTALHHQLLEQYAAPSMVLNQEFDILHISDKAGRFLQIAGGELSKNAFQIARPELRIELRTALHQAIQRKTPVVTESITVKTDDGVEAVNIHVRPVLRNEDPNRGYILVIFETSQDASTETAERVVADEPLSQQLEEELVQTKAQLRATVEQYEVQHEELRASNEELQAINEELRSAVEEIETSKEELESVNEELSTVNQELKIKIEELSQANSDFQNLIDSTMVGTIFLNRSLQVKLYTEAVTEIFNLIPGDIGRPLSDLRSNIEDFRGISKAAEGVLRTLKMYEQEVKADGRTYAMRILPYRTGDDRINGVVITFFDISRRIESENQLRESVDRLNEVLETLDEAFYSVDKDFNFIFINKRAEELWNRPRSTLLGKHFWTEFPETVDSDSYVMHHKALETGQKVHYETLSPILGKPIDVTIYPDMRGGLSCYFRDISAQMESETRRQLEEQKLQLMFESATDFAIMTIDETGTVTTWSRGAEMIFGFPERDMLGRPADIVFTGEDRQNGVPAMEMEDARTNGRAEDERWHVRKDGSRFFASGVMQPLRGAGNPGYVKILRDQTLNVMAETAVREKDMLKELVTTQEDERRRIARDLHDHLGQQMTSLRLKLGSAKDMCEDEKVCAEIEVIQRIAEQLDKDVDFLAWELRPASLDDLGLKVTLGNFVTEWSRHSGIIAEFHSTGMGKTRLAFEVETNLYRIGQEALNNILKHAKAKSVSVLLEKRGGTVALIVEDDGVGFDPVGRQNRKRGLGLVGMRERAAVIQGTLEIESAKGKGTTIFVKVPAKLNSKGE